MSKPIVWILKEQMRRTNIGTEPMDFGSASAYGELQFVTQSDIPLYARGSVQAVWDQAVKNFVDQYDEDKDFIITVGQPTSIFAIGHALGTARKIPRYLIWRREENRYRVFDTPISLAETYATSRF